LKLRGELGLAVEHAEVQALHKALRLVKEEPGLPESELEEAENLLSELRSRESEQILAELHRAEEAKDYRAVPPLIRRAQRAAGADIVVEKPLLEHAKAWAADLEKAKREEMEKELQMQRIKHDFATWTKEVPECGVSVPFPSSSVVGELEVLFEPCGEQLMVLPREIVEGTLVVGQDESYGDGADVQSSLSTETMAQLLTAVEGIIDPEDEIVTLTSSPKVIESEGWSHRRTSGVAPPGGRSEQGIAIYVRAEKGGREIAQALTSQSSTDLVSSGASALQNIAPPSGSPLLNTSRKVADYTSNVRSRVLRRITVELMWTYPKGIMDVLDASCILFDDERLVEIIDHRGMHGLKYSAAGRLGAKGQPISMDGSNGSVVHAGDILDTEQRIGRQVIKLSLDLLPERVTDIFFSLSACNSRDLSRFAKMTATVYDSDTMRPLVTHDIEEPGNTEAVIMLCLYHRSDGLWRVNAIRSPCSFCKGTTRDYKALLGQLLKIGYPRNVSMRQQVPPLLASIQRLLAGEVPVKATGISLSSISTMRLAYALEIFGPTADTDAIGEDLVEIIEQDSFRDALALDLVASGGERFTIDHLEVFQAEVKSMDHIEVRLCWKFPGGSSPYVDGRNAKESGPPPVTAVMPEKEVPIEIKRKGGQNRNSPRSGPKTIQVPNLVAMPAGWAQACLAETKGEGSNYLDATCFAFEDQALREVVDYRGPHGVRVVTMGVLDYRGVWSGHVGIGDASGGAISHAGERMDNVANTGQHTIELRFEKMPRSVTDLIFVMSSANKHPMYQYGDLHAMFCDAEDPGHEIAVCPTPVKELGEAVVLCKLARDSAGCWSLSAIGSMAPGTCRDYRPTLQCLRAIQEKTYTKKLPQWPHRVLDGAPRHFGELTKPKSLLPRLPEPKAPGGGRRGSGSSILSAAASVLAQNKSRRVSSRLSNNTQLTPGASPSLEGSPDRNSQRSTPQPVHRSSSFG